ncbi:MAG: MATE family efflux transporter [Myxococcota bacterium]
MTVTDSTVAQPSSSVMGELGRLLILAWPVALAHLGSMLMGVTDVYMVGQLGDQPLAAVSLGHTYSFAFMFPLLGVAIGLDPLFAQAFGAQQPERAGAALARGAALLVALCIPIMGLQLLSGPLLLLVGQEPAIVEAATPYIWIRALSVIPFALFSVIRQFLQGAGRMWQGTVAIVVGNIANVALNGWLLFGWFGGPTLGPSGTAWATVGSTTLMMIVLIGLCIPTLRRGAPRRTDALDFKALLPRMGVCLPIGLQVGLEGWGFSISTFMVGTLGETALAAHTVALTLASLAFMVPLGISSAAATRVGNLLGAGHAWGRAGWLSVGIGAASMVLFASAFLTLPGWLSSWFLQGEEALALATLLMPVAAGFALFDGTQVVAFGVLRGAGDTTVPAIANIVGYYLVGLPLGAVLLFGFDMGAVGVWIGLATALFCVAVILLFRLGFTQRQGGYLVGASRP